MENKIPFFLLYTESDREIIKKPAGNDLTFLDRTLQLAGKTVKTMLIQAESGSKCGFINTLHPSVKLVSLVWLLVSISFVNQLINQVIVTVFIAIAYFFSGIRLQQVIRKIIFTSFFFGFLILLPAVLNIFVPGNILFNIFILDKPYHFWIYTIPQKIGVTTEGLSFVALMFFRVLNSVSLTLLVVYSTPFSELLRSLKLFRVPDYFLMVITLTHKYIFTLSKTIEATYLAFRSRVISLTGGNEVRHLVAGRVFFIFRKSMADFELTYQAMVSRAYNGDIVMIANRKIRYNDVTVLVFVITFGLIAIFI